jgi:hypothetical protein
MAVNSKDVKYLCKLKGIYDKYMYLCSFDDIEVEKNKLKNILDKNF